jgi:hypothetical protein
MDLNSIIGLPKTRRRDYRFWSILAWALLVGGFSVSFISYPIRNTGGEYGKYVMLTGLTIWVLTAALRLRAGT